MPFPPQFSPCTPHLFGVIQIPRSVVSLDPVGSVSLQLFSNRHHCPTHAVPNIFCQLSLDRLLSFHQSSLNNLYMTLHQISSFGFKCPIFSSLSQHSRSDKFNPVTTCLLISHTSFSSLSAPSSLSLSYPLSICV